MQESNIQVMLREIASWNLSDGGTELNNDNNSDSSHF